MRAARVSHQVAGPVAAAGPRSPACVHEAFRACSSGRPRPVEIEVPPDVLQTPADVDAVRAHAAGAARTGDLDLIDRAAQAARQGQAAAHLRRRRHHRQPGLGRAAAAGRDAGGAGHHDRQRPRARSPTATTWRTARARCASCARAATPCWWSARASSPASPAPRRRVRCRTSRSSSSTSTRTRSGATQPGRRHRLPTPSWAWRRWPSAWRATTRARPSRRDELTALKDSRGRAGRQDAAAARLRHGDPRRAAGGRRLRPGE